MGLFDFFRKKPAGNTPQGDPAPQEIPNENIELLNTLKNRLNDLGYAFEWHTEYMAITLKGEIEIAGKIIEHPDSSPKVLHLLILTSHPTYFPHGIIENLLGAGNTFQEKVNTVIDNYINSTFYPIIESFTERAHSNMDILGTADGKEVLWHPQIGNLMVQGSWSEPPEYEVLFEILRDKLPDVLTTNKFNWLKLYIFKQKGESITGECLLNNEFWDEGMNLVSAYAESWNLSSDFQGLKQFIVFRKCDAYD